MNQASQSDIRKISGILMTLALVQLVFATIGYLLRLLPLNWSGLSWQHVAYGPVIFVLAYLFGAFEKMRMVSLAIALVLLAAILYEGYDYTTAHMDMIAADLSYTALAIAGAWRVLLALITLRGVYGALRG